MDEETVSKEKYYRLAADFENFRKRMVSELADAAKFAGEKVIHTMVDVADHLDSAIKHAPASVKEPIDWWKGVEQIDKQFAATLKKHGVRKIETVGKPFDPATMEAVSMASGGESQTVKEEVRAGYTMHERVIRPARVIVYE